MIVGYILVALFAIVLGVCAFGPMIERDNTVRLSLPEQSERADE